MGGTKTRYLRDKNIVCWRDKSIIIGGRDKNMICGRDKNVDGRGKNIIRCEG